VKPKLQPIQGAGKKTAQDAAPATPFYKDPANIGAVTGAALAGGGAALLSKKKNRWRNALIAALAGGAAGQTAMQGELATFQFGTHDRKSLASLLPINGWDDGATELSRLVYFNTRGKGAFGQPINTPNLVIADGMDAFASVLSEKKLKSADVIALVCRIHERDKMEEFGALLEAQSQWYDRHELGSSVVPGCFEIPVVATTAARSGKYAAIVTLGAVIKGETPHFDYVAGECARGVMEASRETGTPVIFGVLTTDTVEQALNRSGIKFGNKGRDAASAAIEMAETMAKFNGAPLS
jgi:6,7-dimethyl-8-ribityllumazine synthase